jgi:hypothetical protein
MVLLLIVLVANLVATVTLSIIDAIEIRRYKELIDTLKMIKGDAGWNF